MKEWKLIKDYTVPDGETYKTISTPEESEMSGYNEICILFESFTVTSDSSEVDSTGYACPQMANYNDVNYSYGRISPYIENSIGSSVNARKLYLRAEVIDNMLIGHAGNASYSIQFFQKVTAKLPGSFIPKINMNNKDGNYYSAGTNIKVYVR